MRGVPRERRAISAAPSVSQLDVEQAGRAADDPLEVLGLVELQVRGEAEPVAQRAGQQPGPGGGADQGERRDLQRDGGGARPLADDDVDPEVLHRHVEHLLGGPRHPVDLVDEEHVTLVEPGEDRGEVTGVRDRRSAGQPQRGAHLGGDDHRQGGLAEARRTATAARGRAPADAPRAASSTSESCSRTRSWPTTSSSVRGRSAASTTRSSPSASAAVSGRWSCRPLGLLELGLVHPTSGLAQRAQGARSSRADVGRGHLLGLGRDLVDGAVGLLGRPAEADEAGLHLVLPVLRAGVRPRARAGRRPGDRSGRAARG